MAMAQPTADLDPADTEAIIAAFLSDATDQQWDDEAVNEVLEQILQQDSELGNNLEGDPSVPHPDGAQCRFRSTGPTHRSPHLLSPTRRKRRRKTSGQQLARSTAGARLYVFGGGQSK